MNTIQTSVFVLTAHKLEVESLREALEARGDNYLGAGVKLESGQTEEELAYAVVAPSSVPKDVAASALLELAQTFGRGHIMEIDEQNRRLFLHTKAGEECLGRYSESFQKEEPQERFVAVEDRYLILGH